MEGIKYQLQVMESFELQILGCLYKITQDKINGQPRRMKACHKSLKVKATVIEKEIDVLQKENMQLKKTK